MSISEKENSIIGKQGLLHCQNHHKDEIVTLIHVEILFTTNTPISVWASFFRCPCGSIHRMKWDGSITDASEDELNFLQEKGRI